MRGRLLAGGRLRHHRPPASAGPRQLRRCSAAKGGAGGVPGEGVRLHFEEREETLLFGSILKRQLVYPSF